MSYDPDAIYQDADIEMAELTASANREAALRKKGICTHGWLKNLKCLYCGRQFKSDEEHEETRREILC